MGRWATSAPTLADVGRALGLTRARRLVQAHGGQILTDRRASKIVVRGGRAVGVRTATRTYPARRAVLATVQPQALFLDLVDELRTAHPAQG